MPLALAFSDTNYHICVLCSHRARVEATLYICNKKKKDRKRKKNIGRGEKKDTPPLRLGRLQATRKKKIAREKKGAHLL